MSIGINIFKLLPMKTSRTFLNVNCIQINYFLRTYAQARKRFYKNTGILHSNGKFEVTLDQRKLKTPKGNPFIVNSEPLALAVATEWNSQKEKIIQTSMHLTTLCNTAIDNPNNLKKYDMVEYIVNYLETDTILFQSDEEELYKFQVQEWDPIIQWFCNRFQVNIEKSRDMGGPKINDETMQKIKRYLLSYDQEAIFGYVYGVDTLKSVILTLACAEKHITPERAVLLSRLEEEFQLGHWGRVEWAHDLNQQDLQSRLSAAILYIYCNSSSYLSKIKGNVESNFVTLHSLNTNPF